MTRSSAIALPQNIRTGTAFWLAACIVVGVACIAFQGAWLFSVLICIGALVASKLARRVQLWRACILFSLTGFIVLNYGFENLIAGHVAGIPLIVGEMLMFAGLAQGWWRRRERAAALFGHPAMKCTIALWLLASVHLISNVPKFGLYAFRDASIFFEALFLVAGFVWALEPGGIRKLNRWLLFLFVANFLYACTLPVGETLQEHSPASGVFQPIPLLGQYQHNGLYIVSGALFCIWMAPYVVHWKRWTSIGLAVIQLSALVILQTRSMYIGMVLVVLVTFVIGERRKCAQFLAVMGFGVAAIVTFVVIVSAFNINIQGRVMEISGTSIREHVASVFALTDQQDRLGQDQDRLDWMNQVWTDTTADAGTLIFGQGFGKPLIDFERDGVPVRQPHNSTLGVFGRLGVSGVIVWITFHLYVFNTLLNFIRRTRGSHNENRDFMVWLLGFYVLALLLSMVQPAFEFSHCAVPLYFLLGVGLSIAHTAPQTGKLATVGTAPSTAQATA
jgi:hypothetical protein